MSRKPWADRGSRHARGYGSGWQKLRLRILDRDKHLCQEKRPLANSVSSPASPMGAAIPVSNSSFRQVLGCLSMLKTHRRDLGQSDPCGPLSVGANTSSTEGPLAVLLPAPARGHEGALTAPAVLQSTHVSDVVRDMGQPGRCDILCDETPSSSAVGSLAGLFPTAGESASLRSSPSAPRPRRLRPMVSCHTISPTAWRGHPLRSNNPRRGFKCNALASAAFSTSSS